MARYDTAPDGATRRGTDVALADAVTAACSGADAVLVADYGLGTLGPRVHRRLARLREKIRLLVVDAHDPAAWTGLRPDAVTPNAAEAAVLLGRPAPVVDRVGWAVRHHRALVERAGGGAVLLTLDTDGAVSLPPAGPPTWRAAAHRDPEGRACGATPVGRVRHRSGSPGTGYGDGMDEGPDEDTADRLPVGSGRRPR